MTNDEKYEEAKKRVKELKDFYRNLLTYVGVNILLIVINLLTSPGRFWFYWVTIFWGFGILLHASKVFVLKGNFLGKGWEEKKMKELMEKGGAGADSGDSGEQGGSGGDLPEGLESALPDDADELAELLTSALEADGAGDVEPETPEKEEAGSELPVVAIETEDYIKPDIFDECHALVTANINALLSGPAGCGKSRMVKEIATAMDLPFFTQSFSGGMRYAQVFGTTQIKTDGSTEWVPSQLLQAVQQKGVVLLDEIFSAEPDIALGLNCLIEADSRSIMTPIGRIDVHEECHFVGAANTVGRVVSRHFRRLLRRPKG